MLALSCQTRAADEQPNDSEPDHLVPVNPYPGDRHVRYTDQIRRHFKLDPPFYLQLLVRPSFTPEYVIRMHGNEKNPWSIKEAEKVFLTYSAGNKSIWYSMPENNDPRKQQKVTVSSKTAEVPKPLAERLHKLWTRMLWRTRYPDTGRAWWGLDGTIYEFGMWGVYGEVWSPEQRQSPLLFIELGESLITYCKAAPAERAATAKSNRRQGNATGEVSR